MSVTFETPMFGYGSKVKIVPLDLLEGRVVELHQDAPGPPEYNVRYFQHGEAYTVRFFEDELEALCSKL